MEAENCCAYNATRGCKLSSKVVVADSALEPLKVLKVLVEGLARDSESSLWLRPLKHPPHLARLFAFDFVYLDGDDRVIEGAALLPGVPIPQFTDRTASALVLPSGALARTETRPGDRIMVCAEEDLEERIAETSASTAEAPVMGFAEAPQTDRSPSIAALPSLPQYPLPGLRVSVPTHTASIPQGSGFTATMTAGWQISSSTMAGAAAAVLEPGEVREPVAEKEREIEVEAGESDAAGTESADAQEEGRAVTGESEEVVSDAASDPAIHLSEPVLDTVPEPGNNADRAVEIVESPREAPVADSIAPLVAEAAVAERPNAHPDAEETRVEAPIPQRKDVAEKRPAVAAVSKNADPVTTRKKSREQKKKESLGVLVKRFLNCEDPLPERRSIIRLVAQGLVGYTDRDKTKPHEVRDVSPSGLYLRTEERWKPGEVISLEVRKKGAAEDDHGKRVRVDTRVVRCDEGGAGMVWLWPDGVEFEPWKRVHTKRSDETDADYFLRELRLARALGFLRQICPAALEEMKLALHQRLSSKRIASAVEIALKGLELHGPPVRGASRQAHPDMVRRIIENGSWTDDDWIRQWWAGLLVSSCSTDAPDTSNSVFIDLLAKLTPVHLRVLAFVCRKGTELLEAGVPAAAMEVHCTSEELIEAVGSHSLARIQQTMGQLSSLGLLAESNKPSYVAVTDKVKTRATPTALALKMYARCHGRP